MADTLVESVVSGGTDAGATTQRGPYYINTTTGAIVYTDGGDDINFTRTTDGGVNWSPTELVAGSVRAFAVWFDQETPGDAGTLLHVIWLDATANTVFYRSIDINDGTMGTQRTVDGAVTVSNKYKDNRCAIVKTRDSNLLAAWSTQTEIECVRSTDSFATTPTDRADVFEAAIQEDWCFLYPANTADTADAAALFWDRSAQEISVKMYDHSANTWTETSILTGMAPNQIWLHFDAAVRHSDKHILGGAHSTHDTTADDLKTFDINPNSIASPGVTIKTDVFTNQGESVAVGLLVNQQNDDVYITYLKGGAWLATMDAVYHKSTDGMASWGAEQAYSQAAADDLRTIHAGRTVGNSGGFFQPVFFNDDTIDLFVNLVNDVAIAASGQVFTQSILASTPGTGTLSTMMSAFRTLAPTTPTTPVLSTVMSAFRSLTSTSPGTGVLSTIMTAPRTLAATASEIGSLTTSFIKPLTVAASSAVTAVLTTIKTIAQAIAASSPGTSVLSTVATFARSLAPTTAVTAVLSTVANFFRSMAASSSVTAVLSSVMAALRTLAASAPVTATLNASQLILKTLIAATSVLTSLRATQLILKTLTATTSVLTTLTTLFIKGAQQVSSMINTTVVRLVRRRWLP